MMKVELRKYKALLANKQTELAGRINNRDGIAIEKTADALDEVQFAGERELAIRNLDRESTLLRRVRAAQERLTGGTFGDCLHCEAAISPKRLSAAPWSVYCLKCQEAADRGDRDNFFAEAA
jgi:DnaK suppressor protein